MGYATKEAAQRWRDAHKKEQAEYGRAYRKKHFQRLKLQKQKYRRTHYAETRAMWKRYSNRPEVKKHQRERFLQKAYGISLAKMELLLKDQKGRCAICFQILTTVMHKSNTCHVDHDHQRQHVRGLLCNKCNRGLGLLNDDPQLLEAAITYLQKETC